jgi:hypothetical protein
MLISKAILKKHFKNVKRKEETRDWRKLYEKEFNNLFSSPYIFRMNESRG